MGPLPAAEQITQEYIAKQQATLERQALLKVLEATRWRIRGKQGAARITELGNNVSPFPSPIYTKKP